ncbi:MAG: endonuclease [Bacteroidota bacterium]
MKKKITLFAILMAFTAIISFAQTTLPTSWACDPAALPNGWTTNLTDYYNSGSAGFFHNTAPACKFNSQGKFVMINFTDLPGTVSYWIRGTSGFAGGTFTVEESVDGSTWTPVHVFTDANVNKNVLVNYTDNLTSTSRYVRFMYTTKVSENICIDDISITQATPGPAAWISIKNGTTTIPTGSQLIVGNAPATTLKVINSGTDSTLYLTSSNFTGTDASMFGLTGFPSSVPAHDSVTFTLDFTPTGADGSKTAILTIGNSDPNKNPFVINLYGVKGSFATEPTAKAINVHFTYQKTFQHNVVFDDPSAKPEHYIVLRSIDTPVADEPVDGTTYKKGAYIGTSQVVMVCDSGISFRPLFVVPGTIYYYKIFSFNGPTGYENYLTTNAAADSVITADNMIGTYYATINPASPTFKADLHNLINPHTTLYYSDYATYLIRNYESRDTVVANTSQKVVTCIYSGYPTVYTDPFSWSSMNREHTFCQSWMPTVGYSNFQNMPEYSDYHNLFPASTTANSHRSDIPLGVVVQNPPDWTYGGCKVGNDTAGNKVFEPRDEQKGDAARAMMYMLVCYNGVGGELWKLPDYISGFMPYGQDEAVLKAWNISDPVDNWEMGRNDYIQSVQDNRNPFVDSVQWVNAFNFSDMGQGIVRNSLSDFSVVVFPSPSDGDFTVLYDCRNSGQIQINITSMDGQLVFTTTQACTKGTNTISLSTALPSGLYMMRLAGDGGVTTKKVLINK